MIPIQFKTSSKDIFIQIGGLFFQPFNRLSAESNNSNSSVRKVNSWHARLLAFLLATIIFINPLASAAELSSLAPVTRKQSASMTKVVAQIDGLTVSTNEQRLYQVGKEFLEELKKSRQLFRRYDRANTRFGTIEERKNVKTIVLKAVNGRKDWGYITDLPKFDPMEGQKKRARKEKSKILKFIADRIEEKLEADGISDILTARGKEEVKQALQSAIQTNVNNEIEQCLERKIGFAFAIDEPLKVQVRKAARNAARQEIQKILFKISSSEFVVSIAAGIILRWIGPKLKELFRHKKSLRKRVDRTLRGFERRRQQLHALMPDEKLNVVEDTVESAAGAIGATKLLKKDIKKRQKTELLQELGEGEKKLKKTIKFTRKRFLMNSVLYQQDFSELIILMTRIIRDIEKSIASLKDKAAQDLVIVNKSDYTISWMIEHQGKSGRVKTAGGQFVTDCDIDSVLYRRLERIAPHESKQVFSSLKPGVNWVILIPYVECQLKINQTPRAFAHTKPLSLLLKENWIRRKVVVPAVPQKAPHKILATNGNLHAGMMPANLHIDNKTGADVQIWVKDFSSPTIGPSIGARTEKPLKNLGSGIRSLIEVGRLGKNNQITLKHWFSPGLREFKIEALQPISLNHKSNYSIKKFFAGAGHKTNTVKLIITDNKFGTVIAKAPPPKPEDRGEPPSREPEQSSVFDIPKDSGPTAPKGDGEPDKGDEDTNEDGEPDSGSEDTNDDGEPVSGDEDTNDDNESSGETTSSDNENDDSQDIEKAIAEAEEDDENSDSIDEYVDSERQQEKIASAAKRPDSPLTKPEPSQTKPDIPENKTTSPESGNAEDIEKEIAKAEDEDEKPTAIDEITAEKAQTERRKKAATPPDFSTFTKPVKPKVKPVPPVVRKRATPPRIATKPVQPRPVPRKQRPPTPRKQQNPERSSINLHGTYWRFSVRYPPNNTWGTRYYNVQVLNGNPNSLQVKITGQMNGDIPEIFRGTFNGKFVQVSGRWNRDFRGKIAGHLSRGAAAAGAGTGGSSQRTSYTPVRVRCAIASDGKKMSGQMQWGDTVGQVHGSRLR